MSVAHGVSIRYDEHMISRIEGELIGVEGGRVELSCPPLTYQVLVPAADEMRYSGMVGQTLLLHTLH